MKRVLTAVCLLCLVVPLSAQPKAELSEDEAEKLQKLVEESVTWYEYLPDPEATKPMQSAIVLRWQNASRGQKAEDLMALWIHDGRPQVLASIFPWAGNLCHEVSSLSRQAKFVAREAGSVVWSPAKPGGVFADVPEAPAPAETDPARLRQMKALAQQFSATMTGWKPDNSDREELRLLPRALYRYAMKEASASHPDLVDGAVFAFVQGTDPEVVLVLEAVRAGAENAPKWQYAFARATSGGLEARHGKTLVWSAEKNGALAAQPQAPQTVLRRPIVE